jgi:lysophospholipase L1-like esterase
VSAHRPTQARGAIPPLGARARLALVLGSLAFTLVVLELGLWMVGYEYSPMNIEIGQAGDARGFHVFEDANFEYDPELIWRPKPSQSVFNRQGFRGPELTATKSAEEIRIFAIGDSNTLGWAGEAGPNWPGDLNRLVKDVEAHAVVVNAGVWGYASFQGVRRFRQTLPFEPDIVLVSFGSNDAHRVLRSDRDYAANPIRETGPGQLLRRFRLGELLLAAGDALSRRDNGEVQPRVSLEDYRANLMTIVTEARDRNVDVVLLTRPYEGQIENPYWWKNWGHEYNGATADVAREAGVPLVDVYSFFKDLTPLFADESHFTAEGHARAAAIVLDHIRPVVARRAAAVSR